MRKGKTALLAATLLALLCPGLPGQAGRDYSYQGPYNALGFIDYQYERREVFAPYIDPLIAPLGWSKDGKLAYIVEHNYEALGVGPVFEWVVQDLVSDKVLWSSKPEPEQWAEEHADTEGLPGREALARLFAGMLAAHRAVLQGYGIVPGSAPALRKFPLASGGLRYTAAIRDVQRGEAYEFDNLILGYRLEAGRSDNRRKTLGTFSLEGRALALDVQVAGYIPSPYEPRIAVVLCTTSRGWEGPPNPVGYSLGGCNLKTGFK